MPLLCSWLESIQLCVFDFLQLPRRIANDSIVAPLWASVYNLIFIQDLGFYLCSSKFNKSNFHLCHLENIVTCNLLAYTLHYIMLYCHNREEKIKYIQNQANKNDKEMFRTCLLLF